LAVPQPTKPEVERAITALSELIDAHPKYASAYTNRAQALRLVVGDAIFTQIEDEVDLERIFADLGTAISLATPSCPTQTASVSPQQAQVLATAHSHRAYLDLKAAQAASASPTLKLECGPEMLRGMDKDRLEEMASREFEAAGRYGDKVAREMAVRTNPYAKMCGAIVKKALREEVAEGRW
jgi:hypothetical protein